MAHNFLWPTKHKLILFVILSLLLFYLPVVPTLTTPVVLNPTSTWNLKSPAESLQNIQIVGVSNMYFGTLTGADAALVSIASVIMIAYLLSAVLVYLFKREPKDEKEAVKGKPAHP
jgi:hypothetical protein